MKWLIILLVFIVTPQVVIADGDYISVGDYLPSFSVHSNLGKTFSSFSLEGKPVFILFFNTKCFDCRRELPIVQKLYEEFRDKVTFIAISRAQPENEIVDYWSINGLDIPYAAQGDKTIFCLFARKIIPRIYICNSHGEIMHIFKEKIKYKRLYKAIRKTLLVENTNIKK